MRRYSGNLASKSAVKAVISQELDTISRLAKENNWGKRKIQKEIRMLQSEVKKRSDKMSLKLYQINTTLNHPDCMAGFKNPREDIYNFNVTNM